MGLIDGLKETSRREIMKQIDDDPQKRVAKMLLPPCPVCGGDPMVEQCEPWPRECGPAPWYVGCYKGGGDEHFVGVNGDTRDEAMRLWRIEVADRLAPPIRPGFEEADDGEHDCGI